MPKVTINLPYEVLEKATKAYPNLPVEEALRLYITDLVRSGRVIQGKVRSEALERSEDIKRLQRFIQDMLNPYTAKIDAIARRLGEVIEILEAITQRLSNLEEEVKKLKEIKIEVPTVSRERRERVRRSALDILKKQKVMFESDIAPKIKNRDAFFERLKRGGAVVLELANERVAIDPTFWEEFKRKLAEVRSNSESELVRVLGKEGYLLLKALAHSAQAYYDATRKSWVLLTS